MAKKRHHQSLRSREHESRGEKRYEHHKREAREHESLGEARYEHSNAQMAKHGERYPANIGARPMMERHKSMISDDRSAPCNLPQMVMEKYWPASYNDNMGYVDDLFEGVNKQMHEDYRDLGREEGPKKY